MTSHSLPSDFSAQNPQHVAQLQNALLLFNDQLTIEQPELTEKVFGATTRDALGDFQEGNGLTSNGRMDLDTIEEINLRLSGYNTIYGKISDANGTPINGVVIKAYCDGTSQQLLIGQSTSGKDGTYCLFFEYLDSGNRRTKTGAFAEVCLN